MSICMSVIDMDIDMASILRRMNDIDREEFRRQFCREFNRVTGERGSMYIYEALGISRETGRKCKGRRLPHTTPGVLRKAIELGFMLNYDDQPLTIERLDQFRAPPRPAAEAHRQLELFVEGGFVYEISRKRAASELSVQIKVRRA